VCLEVGQQLKCHIFVFIGVATNGAADRQPVAALRDDDARPEHARRVVEVKVVGQGDALLQPRDAGLVAGLGRALALEGVDQGGLAHVGHPADQHPHRLGQAATARRQRVAGLHQLARGRGFAGVQAQGLGARQGVVMRQPQRGAGGVGHVLLVQHLEGGLALRQLGQQGVAAGAWYARVQQFDHRVNVLDARGNGLLGQVHVAGKPLNCHGAGVFQSLGKAGWGIYSMLLIATNDRPVRT
jgi:hypothetical protein